MLMCRWMGGRTCWRIGIRRDRYAQVEAGLDVIGAESYAGLSGGDRGEGLVCAAGAELLYFCLYVYDLGMYLCTGWDRDSSVGPLNVEVVDSLRAPIPYSRRWMQSQSRCLPAPADGDRRGNSQLATVVG